jgi:mannose/fructose/N-acetylgalactosamine-specific phosphotransferase system component IIC
VSTTGAGLRSHPNPYSAKKRLDPFHIFNISNIYNLKIIIKIYIAFSLWPLGYYLYINLSGLQGSHTQFERFVSYSLLLGFIGLALIIPAIYKKEKIRWLVVGFFLSTFYIWVLFVMKFVSMVWS